MPKRDRGNPERETRERDHQETKANQTIPAMAAGWTPPDNGFEAICFGSIRQLLPTFDCSAPGVRPEDTILHNRRSYSAIAKH